MRHCGAKCLTWCLSQSKCSVMVVVVMTMLRSRCIFSLFKIIKEVTLMELFIHPSIFLSIHPSNTYQTHWHVPISEGTGIKERVQTLCLLSRAHCLTQYLFPGRVKFGFLHEFQCLTLTSVKECVTLYYDY